MNKKNQLRNEVFASTTRQSYSMKLLPKIDSSSKAKNINEMMLMKQNLTPVSISNKKPSLGLVDQIGVIPQKQQFEVDSNNQISSPSVKKFSQSRIDVLNEEQKNNLMNFSKSQMGFKPPSSNQGMRYSSSIFDKSQDQITNISNVNSPSVRQAQSRTNILQNQTQDFGKTVKAQTNSITQLQIDADQNRLDFMLEKGMNFEKNSQLIKLKQDNFTLNQEIRKQDSEIKRLRQEIDFLKQQGQRINQQNIERNSQPQILDETYLMLEKKIQQNEYFKQQFQNMKSQYENEANKLQNQLSTLTQQLNDAQQQIQSFESHICQPQSVDIPKEDKDVKQLVSTEQIDDCKSCDQYVNIINDLKAKVKQLNSDNNNLVAQNDSLIADNLSIKDMQQREKTLYEKHIQEQSEEILQLDKQLRDYKKQYDSLNEKIKQVKNGSDFSKVLSRNEYVLLQTEMVDNIERLCKERLDRVNENAVQIQSLQTKHDEEKTRANKLKEELSSLQQHLEWLKKRGGQMSKQNGTFNYLGLSEEILELKKVIDQQIQSIPNKDALQNFSSQVDEMNVLNNKMVEKINKLQLEEEKTRKTIESVPVLKQFDIAQTKVEYHISCAKCEDILTEAITCVPCGHNYCKKCHYNKGSTSAIQGENDPDMPDAAISCLKCGPSTMVYRNEQIDEMIDMYKVMKSAKEVMKAYLSQQ